MPNDEVSRKLSKLEAAGLPPIVKIERSAIPKIQALQGMHFPVAESMTPKEETTPAGVIVPAAEIIQAEPVPESDTQRLRRMLDEFDVFSNDVHGNAEAMHQIRLLAQRIERNHAIHVLQYVLSTVFNDEIRATRKLAGQIGSKSEVRYALLDKLGRGITNLIEANRR